MAPAEPSENGTGIAVPYLPVTTLDSQSERSAASATSKDKFVWRALIFGTPAAKATACRSVSLCFAPKDRGFA